MPTGRPKANLEPQKGWITDYVAAGFPYDRILSELEQAGVSISLATLKRNLTEWGVRSPKQRPKAEDSEWLRGRIAQAFWFTRTTDEKLCQELAEDGFPINPQRLAKIRKDMGLYKQVTAGGGNPVSTPTSPQAMAVAANEAVSDAMAENDVAPVPESTVSSPLRIICHNIRYATTSPFKGEKPWSIRRPLILSELLQQTRFLDGEAAPAGSFICLQEVLHGQLQDILSGLNSHSGSKHTTNWQHIGVGREDGKKKGEYSPILYPTRMFKLLHFENKWLSLTPQKPSKGWDASSERILTIGVFENRHTGQRFVAANTHLDNDGSVAREQSVWLILDSLEKVRRDWADDKGELPYFVAGDFNSSPTQEAYKAMIASGQVADVYDLIPQKLHFGDEITFTGFERDTDENADEKGRIDFVWLGPKSSVAPQQAQRMIGDQTPRWMAKGYSVIPNVFDSGLFASDHRAVVADVALG